MTSTHTVCDLRIVLLGKTGSGKSAAGNTILGKKVFEVADFIKSTSKVCEKQEGVVGGKTVSIIDTPGLFNTAMNKHQLKTEIEKCVEMCSPGPHVFLLVIKLGVRFTKEETDAVLWIQENFGEEALRRTIILFTHADQLRGKPLDKYIKESDHLQEIVRSCGGRYHSFNYENSNHRVQVTELLKNINTMMHENKINSYTTEMFKSTQTEIARREWIKKIKIACVVALLTLGIVFAFLLLQEKPSSQPKEISPQQQEKPSSKPTHISPQQEKPSSQLIEISQMQQDELLEEMMSQLLEKMMSQLPDKKLLQLLEKTMSQLPEKMMSQLQEKMVSQRQEKMMSQMLEKMVSQLEEKMMS